MKEDFDDILRKKWEERQFPVDQAHRADMIRLLDQNNRRRTGFVWWFFGVGVACTIVALIVIVNDADRLKDTVVSIDNVITIEAQAENEAKAKAKAEELDNSNSRDKNQVQASVHEIQDANAQTNGRNEIETQGSNGELRHADAYANKAQDANAETSDENETGSHLKVEKLRHTWKAEGKAKDDSKAKAEAKAKEIIRTEVMAEDKTVLKDNVNKKAKVDDEINSTETKEAFVPSVTPKEGESTVNPAENPNENTVLVVRNDFVTDPIDALAFGNIDFSVNNEIGNVEPVIVRRHPLWLYAEAGAGFVPAPKSNIKSGYTLRAGGGVGYGLSARQSLTLSGGYVMQKNGFDFQRSSTVQQSGFAARSNFNTLTPDRLHFVYARLGVHHRIKRHMISVFGGGQYLYGAQGTVLVKSDDQLTGISEKTKYAWLKIDGMNRLWWNAELTYGYQITPRFSLQAGVKYNFTSIVATDQELIDEGYYWKGDLSSLSPSFTINYHLYGKR